jgi:uncharacterized membrane protein YccC
LTESLTDTLTAEGPPLLFGLRLWASVCLALLVAFWIQLDNPFWAGTSAAIVCQPQLGASLRKGWFRLIGTAIGATAIVVLTAFFPQDRVAFLGLLALWGGLCAFGATVLTGFASYAAALAGYTAAIVASYTLGATGGPSADVFMLAVFRASEICSGIVCAGIVLAATDLGGAQRRLAASFADLAAAIAGGFTRMLALAGPQPPDTQTERRELVRRVIALDPIVDQVLGESSHVRYQMPTVHLAVHGLFRALDGWRGVAAHLGRRRDEMDERGPDSILRSIPPELQSGQERVSPARWMAHPMALRRASDDAVRTLRALPAPSPSLRLLADETAKVLDGIVHALDGLALLVDAPGHPQPARRGFRPNVADWLPALINAARAVVMIGAVELFWVATAWPSGALAIVFVAILILLLSPRGDLAYGASIAAVLGVPGVIVGAAIVKFAVLPALTTFPAFCIAIGVYLVPVGFAMARSRHPAAIAIFTFMTANFMPLLAPTNPMSYDTAQFYNTALAVVVGCGVAPVAFLLLPPLPPDVRARRLLDLTLRDLRRLAIAPQLPTSEEWEGRIYCRLAALPEQAEPLQRARLLATLSVGAEIIQLRRMAPRLGAAAELDAALQAMGHADSATAIAQLHQLDRRLVSGPDGRSETAIALRARGRVLVLAEALATHGSYFNMGAHA